MLDKIFEFALKEPSNNYSLDLSSDHTHSVVDNYGFTWNFKKFTKNSSCSQIIQRFHRQARSQCQRGRGGRAGETGSCARFDHEPLNKSVTSNYFHRYWSKSKLWVSFMSQEVVRTSCGNRHKGTNSRHGSREVILIYCWTIIPWFPTRVGCIHTVTKML